MGFLVMGCFWGRPRPYFTVGLAGSVGFWGTFRVGKGASSSSDLAVASGSFGLAVTSSLSGLAVASSSSGLILWVSLGRK